MERGELGDSKPEETISRLSVSDTEAPSVTVADIAEERRSMHSDKAEEPKEGAPDAVIEGATETVWLEPHRKVIERCPSQGED
ncbi:hypothetical protein H0H93_005280, partial [Arthromyces matolae]